VYPPRYLLFCAFYINLALLCFIALLSLLRLLWCCWEHPDDLQLLFDACVLSNPDVMRVKTWAVFKRRWLGVDEESMKRKKRNSRTRRQRAELLETLKDAVSRDVFIEESEWLSMPEWIQFIWYGYLCLFMFPFPLFFRAPLLWLLRQFWFYQSRCSCRFRCRYRCC